MIGGFDLSARKFLKTDELIFSVPLPLYRNMLAAMENSALTRHTWQGVRKKVRRSTRTWGEEPEENAEEKVGNIKIPCYVADETFRRKDGCGPSPS